MKRSLAVGALAVGVPLGIALLGLFAAPHAALGVVAMSLLVAYLSDARAGMATLLVAISSPLYYAKDGALEHAQAFAQRGLAEQGTRLSFDVALSELACDLFPWSGLLPFALAALTQPPAQASEKERALRVLLLSGSTLCYGLSALLVSGPARFAGVGFAAGAIGLWFWDIARGARVPRPLLLALALLVSLLALDFSRIPAQRARAFSNAVTAAELADAERLLGQPLVLTVSAALVVAGAALLGLHDAFAPAGRAMWPRSTLFAPFLLSGLLLRFAYYPSLDPGLSTKAVLAAFQERARAGDTLGVLRSNRKAARDLELRASFLTAEPERAVEWLAKPAPDARRFLAIERELFARANAEFRSRNPFSNLPVLEAEDLTLLAVNRIESGEGSVNPLDRFFFQSTPPEFAPLAIEFGRDAGEKGGGQVRLLGWDTVDEHGAHLAAVQTSTQFRLRAYYELAQGDVSGHCTFLHIDHRPTRFNLVHDWKEYPLGLWRAGDRIVDEYEVELPPHFVAGDYAVYLGFGVLPCRDERRLPVTRGAHDHQRGRIGTLSVR